MNETQIKINAHMDNVYILHNNEIKTTARARAKTSMEILPELMHLKSDTVKMDDIIDGIEAWKASKVQAIIDKEESMALVRAASAVKKMTDSDLEMCEGFKWYVTEGQQKLVSLIEDENSDYTYRHLEGGLRVSLSTSNPKKFQELKTIYENNIQTASATSQVPNYLHWMINTTFTRDNDIRYPKEAYNFEVYLDLLEESVLEDTRLQINEPQVLSNNMNTPAFLHVNIESVVVKPTPTWDDWLNIRFRDDFDRKLFMAYAYSLVIEENVSRQALWLWDNGQTGKSTILNTLYKFIGNGSVSFSTAELTGDGKRFAGSKLPGKRVVFLPDCKFPGVIRTELIHNVLGGDPISVEKKNEQALSKIMRCKILVAANTLPEIDTTQDNLKSRVRIIRLKDNSELTVDQRKSYENGHGYRELERALLQECPSFMANCKDAYTEMYGGGHGNITLSADQDRKMFDDVTSPEVEDFEHVIDSFLEFTEDTTDYTPRMAVQLLFKNTYEGNMGQYTITQFYKFLETAGKRKQGRLPVDISSTRTRVWYGVKLNTTAIRKHDRAKKNKILMGFVKEQDGEFTTILGTGE